MKVKELIEKLKRFNEDMDIMVSESTGTWVEILEVDTNKSTVILNIEGTIV